MKVLRTITERQVSLSRPGVSAKIHMRIASEHVNLLDQTMTFSNQYYYLGEDGAVLLHAENTNLSFDQYDGLVNALLGGQEQSLLIDNVITALLEASKFTISNGGDAGSGGIFGTTGADWEIVEIPENDSNYDQHTITNFGALK